MQALDEISADRANPIGRRTLIAWLKGGDVCLEYGELLLLQVSDACLEVNDLLLGSDASLEVNGLLPLKGSDASLEVDDLLLQIDDTRCGTHRKKHGSIGYLANNVKPIVLPFFLGVCRP